MLSVTVQLRNKIIEIRLQYLLLYDVYSNEYHQLCSEINIISFGSTNCCASLQVTLQNGRKWPILRFSIEIAEHIWILLQFFLNRTLTIADI